MIALYKFIQEIHDIFYSNQSTKIGIQQTSMNPQYEEKNLTLHYTDMMVELRLD